MGRSLNEPPYILCIQTLIAHRQSETFPSVFTTAAEPLLRFSSAQELRSSPSARHPLSVLHPNQATAAETHVCPWIPSEPPSDWSSQPSGQNAHQLLLLLVVVHSAGGAVAGRHEAQAQLGQHLAAHVSGHHDLGLQAVAQGPVGR